MPKNLQKQQEKGQANNYVKMKLSEPQELMFNDLSQLSVILIVVVD